MYSFQAIGSGAMAVFSLLVWSRLEHILFVFCVYHGSIRGAASSYIHKFFTVNREHPLMGCVSRGLVTDLDLDIP